MSSEIFTARLLLRRWLPADREPFAAMNADPRVMQYFPKILTREESGALIERIEAHFEQRGFGLWAVEIRPAQARRAEDGLAQADNGAAKAEDGAANADDGAAKAEDGAAKEENGAAQMEQSQIRAADEAPAGRGEFAGFIGLSVPRFQAHFTPCVETGWRLAAKFWGRGYATEGARAALDFGFNALGLDEIVSFTTEGNARSRRVMEKLGMTHNPADDFDHPSLPEGHPLRRHVLYRISRA